MTYPLHVYRCRVCGTVATSPFKATYGDPIQCVCRSYMTFQYSLQTTERQTGIVYNPHVNSPAWAKEKDTGNTRVGTDVITSVPQKVSGQSLANYKTAFGSFLKTEDLQGKPCRLVIDAVNTETIEGDHGKEKKLVARFTGKEKGLILNRTNADSIAELAGSEDTDDWQGHAIVLYPDKTKYGGKVVDCMRVRAPKANGKPAPPPPPPVDDEEADLEDAPFMWLMPLVLPAIGLLSLVTV